MCFKGVIGKIIPDLCTLLLLIWSTGQWLNFLYDHRIYHMRYLHEFLLVRGELRIVSTMKPSGISFVQDALILNVAFYILKENE